MMIVYCCRSGSAGAVGTTAGGVGFIGDWDRTFRAIDLKTGKRNPDALTVNADAHPLMSRMHRPDPKRPPDRQDKRSVVSLEPDQWDQWLNGTVGQAEELIMSTPGVKYVTTVVGYSLLSQVTNTYSAFFFITLEHSISTQGNQKSEENLH